MMLQSDKEGHIKAALNQHSKEQSLPPHLPKEQIDALPFTPGVYYFKDAKGKVVYVGKAKNLKKRVCSHFQNNNPGRQKQEFLRSIHFVSYQECGTELIAFILEAIEIKRLWPANNRALKRFEHSWGLYAFEDQNGYLRLAVDKRRKYSTPAYTVSSALEGHQLLRTLLNEFDLCPKLCFIQTNNDPCTNPSCRGACGGHEPADFYNQRIHSAIEHLKLAMPTFALLDQGRSLAEKSCILVEGGKFYGMGYLAHDSVPADLPSLKNALTPYPANEYIKNIVHQHASRFPERKLVFS
jgi:DNA polymerase-3 subunit epsilon